MKKKLILTFGLVLLLMSMALVGWKFYCQSLYDSYKSKNLCSATHHVAGDAFATNSVATYSEQEIAIYGKWLEKSDEITYRTFTLDDAQEGFYWGKEWCESDDVLESDLEEHGNGWFKWRIKNDKVLLVHQANFGFLMPVEYSLVQLDDSLLGVQSRFARSPKVYTRVY